jgi:hypothetical protein
MNFVETTGRTFPPCATVVQGRHLVNDSALTEVATWKS